MVARAYGAVAEQPVPPEIVEVAPGLRFPRYYLQYAELGRKEAMTFFARMPELDVRGKSVLDVGCGLGALCLEIARRGAGRVVGIDTGVDGIRYAQWRLSAEPVELPVDFSVYGGDPAELGAERFDLVVSKDSFERYGFPPTVPDSETMADRLADRLKPGGSLVMRLGPLWKAPYGGQIDSRLPWAHLIFPERTIFDHYREVRPPGKTAASFEEAVGVNRMTLARLRRIMGSTGLECAHFAANVGESPALRVLRALSLVPGLEEFFTQNVYGVWRRPAT